MPAVMAGAGTSLDPHARGDLDRCHPARAHVRAADPAGAPQRGRALRLRTPRVRRLRRLPHRVVLLDHLLGRQRGHRLVVGPLRRGALRHRQPVGLGELRHRPDRPVDPGRHQPGRRPPDGVLPEHHRRAEVPAAAPGGHAGLVLRQERELRCRSTPRAAASTTPSTWPPVWPCSPSSASSARRSPPVGSRTPAATSAGPRSSAPRPARCSTWP